MNKKLLLSALLLTASATVVSDLSASIPIPRATASTACWDAYVYSKRDDMKSKPLFQLYEKNMQCLDSRYKKKIDTFISNFDGILAHVSLNDLHTFTKNYSAYRTMIETSSNTTIAIANEDANADVAANIFYYTKEKIRLLDDCFYSTFKEMLKIVLENITQPTIENILSAASPEDKDALVAQYLSKINSIETLLIETKFSDLKNWKGISLLNLLAFFSGKNRIKLIHAAH